FRGYFIEFLQQLALPLGEFLRRFDLDLDIEVAGLAGAQHRHALALQAELLARLGAFRHRHAGFRAVQRCDVESAAERRRRHGDRHGAEEIRPVALEELVWLHRQEDVEVAGRAAAHAGFAFALQADAGAVLDAGGNVDRQRTLFRDPALAMAFGARIVDRLATAVAGRAGALHRKEALARAHAPGPVAGAACRRLRTRLGAGT